MLRLLLLTNKKNFDHIDHLNYFLQRPINCVQYVKKHLNFCYTNQVYNTYTLNIIYSNWICGFITGEGSFIIRSTSFVFIFDIEQAERRVLDFIKAYFSFNPKVREKKLRLNRKQREKEKSGKNTEHRKKKATLFSFSHLCFFDKSEAFGFFLT